MTSSPRSSEAADVLDPPGIPAAQRCGGGGGEIPAGLRQAGAGENWRREAATRERERWAAIIQPSLQCSSSLYIGKGGSHFMSQAVTGNLLL